MDETLMSTAIKPAPSKTAPPSENMLLPAILTARCGHSRRSSSLEFRLCRNPWSQGYDPTGHWWLSTLIAAVPVIVLLGAWPFM